MAGCVDFCYRFPQRSTLRSYFLCGRLLPSPLALQHRCRAATIRNRTLTLLPLEKTIILLLKLQETSPFNTHFTIIPALSSQSQNIRNCAIRYAADYSDNSYSSHVRKESRSVRKLAGCLKCERQRVNFPPPHPPPPEKNRPSNKTGTQWDIA